MDYTIPRNNRELQHRFLKPIIYQDYTIPRNNRELQRYATQYCSSYIIPYQEIIGNYSCISCIFVPILIIPYQEIIGNYSSFFNSIDYCLIIPYQEIIGNYSLCSNARKYVTIIPYQEIIGNYSCQGWYGILESLSIPQNKKIPLLRII